MTVGGIALLLVASVIWVGVRGLVAKSELESAMPLAVSVQNKLVAGDSTGARDEAVLLVQHSETASSLTSDFVWRAFEAVPAIGVNLSVVRQLADVVSDIANEAVLPLTVTADGISVGDFKPVDGAVDLQPLVDAQPNVAKANAALISAQRDLDGIDSGTAITSLQDGAAKLRSVLDEAARSVDAVDRAVRIVPSILGVSGPRNYLVLFQNPAEPRASGGIAGAVALLHTEGGQMTLAKQVSSAEYTHYDSPVLDLPLETSGIYGEITGQYIQDVNLTPNFVQSAELAQEMWRLQFGDTVDGVISIDPVALSYLLRATGPIALPTGDVLTSDNAVQMLLTDVYARYPDTKAQDAFFAASAASVFSAVAGGRADPISLITALAQSGAERRVLVWNADDSEQSILDGTTLLGALPISDATTQRLGLYLNDATGAKMGSYLDVQTAIGYHTCRNDGRPIYTLDVTISNEAPADAAISLPAYVTADGAFGVPAGSVRTNVWAYGPRDTQNLGATRDGAEAPYHPASDSNYPVSGITVQLAPGEADNLSFSWLGAGPFDGALALEMTPVIHRNETINLDIGC